MIVFSARENVLNNFKTWLFPTTNLDQIPTHEQTESTPEVATETTEPSKVTKAKTNHKISSLKLRNKFFK